MSVVQNLTGGIDEGTGYGRTDADDADEIIEVPSLKGSVLTIVGEAEDFLIPQMKASPRHFAEDQKRVNRCGCAPAFIPQSGEFCALVGLPIKKESGSGIKKKTLGCGSHEPTYEWRLRFAADLNISL